MFGHIGLVGPIGGFLIAKQVILAVGNARVTPTWLRSVVVKGSFSLLRAKNRSFVNFDVQTPQTGVGIAVENQLTIYSDSGQHSLLRGSLPEFVRSVSGG